MARRSFARRSGPRRSTEWLAKEFLTAPTTLDGLTFILDAALDTTELAKLPFTITRTVGLLSIFSNQVGSNEQPHGAMGAMVVSEKAATLGPTALPDPVTEANSDEWFLYKEWDATTKVAATGASFGGIMQIPFDSKAQRKVQEGEQVVFMIANASSAADDAQYYLQFRMLIKLH